MLFTHNTQTHKVKRIKLIFVDENSHLLDEREFLPWSSVAQIKTKIKGPKKRLFYKNIEMIRPNSTLADFGIDQNGCIHVLPPPNIKDMGIINPYDIFQKQEQKSGLQKGFTPKLTMDGTSGTYFLYSGDKQEVAVFKPYDQQPYTPNNPRGIKGKLGGLGIRQGILSGQSATRQVAAYLLDEKGFHRVPTTTYIEFYHPSFRKEQEVEIPLAYNLKPLENQSKTKHGSLQQFIKSKDCAANYSSTLFSVNQVHRIGILDIRIINCDRNQGNILLIEIKNKDDERKEKKRKKNFILVPIDHGLSFPDTLNLNQNVEIAWMQWPQSQVDFSKETLQFIESINVQMDAKMLKQKLGFRQICLRNFKMAQMLLQKGADMGFTLYDVKLFHQIGYFLYVSEQPDNKTHMQKLQELTQNLVSTAINNGFNPLIKIKKKAEVIADKEIEYRSISLPTRRNKNRPDFVHDKKIKKDKNEEMIRKEQKVYHSSNGIMSEKKEELFFHYFRTCLETKLHQLIKQKSKRSRFNTDYFEQ